MNSAFQRFARMFPGLIPLLGVVGVVAFGVLIAHQISDAPAPLVVLQKVAGWAGPLFGSALAIGFVVMAVIQLIKPSLRVPFHLAEIERWLESKREVDQVAYPQSSADDRDTGQFLSQITRGGHEALLALPLEQLTAQIHATADALLANKQYDSWFLHMIIVRPMYDPDHWGYIVQRELDQLQIDVRYRWQRYLRILAIALSTALVAIVAQVLSQWQHGILGILMTIFFVLLVGVLGGFFSSVARDIVAAIEGLRR